MFIIQGIVSGLIATIIFDLFNQSLNYAYNLNKPKWFLLGRYFIGCTRGNYLRDSLEVDDEENNELIWGYGIHYLIGIIYGLFYVFLIFYFLITPLY